MLVVVVCNRLLVPPYSYRSSFDVAEAGVWGNLKKKVEAHQQLPLVYPIISVRIIPKKPPVMAQSVVLQTLCH